MLGARPCCWAQLVRERAEEERGSREDEGLMAVGGRETAGLVCLGRACEARQTIVNLPTRQWRGQGALGSRVAGHHTCCAS